jgi:hypothetical protein
MCFPDKCYQKDIKQLVNYGLSILPQNVLPFNSSEITNSINNVKCQEPKNFDSFAIIAM